MTKNAATQGSPVDHVLAALEKRPTRHIHATNRTYAPPAVDRIRHGAVGMALAYRDQLVQILWPLWFSVAHLGTLVAGALHIFVPLSAAWFASHWSERMEVAVWSGSPWGQAFAFAALWLIALLAWSLAWGGCGFVLAKLSRALAAYAEAGESYYLARQEARDATQPHTGRR